MSHIGPGFGFLIGMKKSEMDNANDASSEEIERLRQQMRAKMKDAFEHQGFGQAAAEVNAEIVQELAAEAAGQKGLRRLSAPHSIEARNEAYAKKAAVNIHRLSAGTVKADASFVETIKRKRALK